MPLPTPFIPQPFANNADSSHKNTIPNTTSTPGLASYDQGFPPDTMQPEVSGGVPPFGQDFNGILNVLSAHLYALQAGQLYEFDNSVASAIGGYPIGMVLAAADGKGFWFNILAANTNDPDAGGAGWVPLFNYGYTTKSGLTGGTVTLSRLEARSGVIVLTGTLISNLAIVLPTTLQSWLIVNATTGAFTTTVRTASGTGVVVAQGGFPAPVGVYGDGTNIYPTVAPVSLPIDQSPTPLTIAQRTNSGYLLSTYFNQNSALENPTIGAVFVQNSSADGYLRKISLANFEAQLLLQNMGGAVTAGQVPSGAVTQYETLFHLANLLGYITDAQILNSSVAQFFNFNGSANGWSFLPGGMIMMWGSVYIGNIVGHASGTITFPTPFLNALLNVQLSNQDNNYPGDSGVNIAWKNGSTSGFDYAVGEYTAGLTEDITLYWFAVGR